MVPGANVNMHANANTRTRAVRRREVPAALYAALPAGLAPVLRRVYAARQVAAADVDTGLSGLLPVGTLGGAAEAAAFLADARERDAAIVVVGDFDADGATASALMVTVLRAFGFSRVSSLVPSRFRCGYGLSPQVAERAAERRPDILITVDNGITSLEGVERARELGMQVLITDHHLPGSELPRSRITVNPNLPGERFASKVLSGVGVAFYAMAALGHELGRRARVDPLTARRTVSACLDLVALGTVADLVSLDRNNRILVTAGLQRIRAGQTRPGLAALFQVAQRDRALARSADLGFAIAPRLNAAGRIEDMALGIDCLLAADGEEALACARRLQQLNEERRQLQSRMQEEAEEHVRAMDAQAGADAPPAFCLFDPRWHEGIVGLVASRVKDRTHRPVVALAPAGQEGWLKGSARSIDGVHIRDLLAATAAHHHLPGLVFGGHAMAAGLRLPVALLDVFHAAFESEARQRLAGLDTQQVLWTDGPLAPAELGAASAEALHFAGPWGQGFAEPLFDNEFQVLGQRALRDRHLRLQLRHVEGGEPIEAIAFNESRQLPARVRLIYRLGINDYGGRRRPQLVVEHVECA